MTKIFVIRKTKNKGKAVFAARNIKKGEIIDKLKGRKIKNRTEHSVQISMHRHIDPANGTAFRMASHSCSPNCGLLQTTKGIFLAAIKNIRKGQEITWDYATAEHHFDYKMRCNCRSRNCRKWINGYMGLDRKTKRKIQNWTLPYLRKIK